MKFLSNKCTLNPYSPKLLIDCEKFDCGHEDLNEFFEKDSINYSEQLLGKSYCFTLDESPFQIVCAFTVSNDSIKMNLLSNSHRNKINRKIPQVKQFKSYPAVLIGRLGVNKNLNGKGIGSELMDFIKGWFANPNNKTGCRFIVVDSYNEKKPLNYYKKNGFNFLFKNEEEEKTSTGRENIKGKLNTRLMYFDLIKLRN